MGKITDALKKAAEERITRLDRISRIKEHERIVIKKMENSAVDSRLVAYFDPKSPITEQYKILMTNVNSLYRGKGPRVLGVSSAIHGEGKTITCLNLAMSLAQAIHKPKILVIDADLRRGRMHKYLGVNHNIGLTEILTKKASIDDALFHIDIDNLTFLAAGSVPHNPVELLSSPRLKDILSDLRVRFDQIIIDTPPLIPVTDPGIIGTVTDGMLLVIQAGRTQRGVINRATELLNQAQVKILGHVLTNVEYHLPEYIYRYL